jgi:hypothetical protein
MDKDIIFYASIYGDINTIILSPYINKVYCTNGNVYQLDDVTEDGEVYCDGQWSHVFVKDCDLLFIHYINLLIDIRDLNNYTFPPRSTVK